MLENEEIKNEDVKAETKEAAKDAEVKEEVNPVDILSKGMEKMFAEVTDTETEVEEGDTKGEVQEEGKDEQPDSKDLGSEKESDGEKKAEADDSHGDEEYETEPIPQEQVDIARKLGYKDDEIIKLAEDSPERLENMVKLYSQPALSQRETPKVEVPEKKEVKEVPKLDYIKVDGLDELEPESAKVVSSILKFSNKIVDHANKQAEQIASLGEQTFAIEQRDKVSENAKIDGFFDSVSDDLPELGKVDSLTPEQAKVRNEIFGMSLILQKSRGLNQQKALEEATFMFGLSKTDLDTIEKDAEERVKEKLNKQKKKMSPRPGGKKKKEKVEKGREAALNYLTKGMQELGLG